MSDTHYEVEVEPDEVSIHDLVIENAELKALVKDLESLRASVEKWKKDHWREAEHIKESPLWVKYCGKD